jgi:hypothetical protein
MHGLGNLEDETMRKRFKLELIWWTFTPVNYGIA